MPGTAPEKRPCRWRRAGLLALCATLAHGCSGPQPPPRPPDVLLISLDTLRADRLDAVREDGTPEMPELARFAAESVRFTDCWSPMAFTLPAHMTMMTGVHPETHAVSIEKSALSPDLPTIAELFSAAGYRTVGLHTSSWLKSDFGFGRGFDRYEELPVALTFADRLIPELLAELASPAAAERPGFYFAHFFDAHSDFATGGNPLSYFSEPESRADLEVAETELCDAERRCATDFLLAADREGRELPAETIRAHFELYRRGVRDLDRRLGTLMRELEATGFLDRALVVVTADHGEEFREHGKFLHSQVYRESLQVPLLIRPPGGRPEGRRVSTFAGLEDLAPTLLAAAGLAAAPAMTGSDLLAPGGAPGPGARVGQDKLVRSRYALRTPERLFVWDFATAAGALFDPASDPAESRNLAPERAAEGVELRKRLFGELRRLRAPRPGLRDAPGAEFGPREREVLRSLGYL